MARRSKPSLLRAPIVMPELPESGKRPIDLEKDDDLIDSKRIKVQDPASSSLGITEADVGIAEYISKDLPGFSGILKQRYTDFLVSEVRQDGSVVRLVDLGLIDKRERRREKRQDERDTRDSLQVNVSNEPVEEEGPEIKPYQPKTLRRQIPVPSDEQKTTLISLLGQNDYDAIVELFHTGSKLQTEKAFSSKDERTKLHQLLREAFQSRLESKTTAENNFVITLATNPAKGARTKLDKSQMGQAKDYLHFVLYKENKDTMEVVNLISKFLRIPPRAISYAGTKDRRGVTAQLACISRVKVERLNGLNKTLRGVKLGSFKYEDFHLRLGDLKGNEFYITIREVDSGSEDIINSALISLKANGFINYYGMQRFGTFSISTHTIGKYVLNSQWEKVVELILCPQELVLPESVKARSIWKETKDAAKALSLMPKKCIAECAILKSLISNPTSYINAVMKIPRNLRVMYAHAYQSYVWNCVASARIRKYGTKVVLGDLVIDNSAAAVPNKGSEQDNNDEEDSVEDQFTKARLVSQSEIDNGTVSIFDVVLPTPGFDVVYPGNEFGDLYRAIMSADEIDSDNMRRNIKEFSLAGSYRLLLARPSNVEWWIKKYENPTDQLVFTDLDLLQNHLDTSHRVKEDTEPTGSKTAVILKLQLGSSQYATMALREIMKIDTARRSDALDVRI